MLYNINRGKGKPAMKADAYIAKKEQTKQADLDNPEQLHKILMSRVRIKER